MRLMPLVGLNEGCESGNAESIPFAARSAVCRVGTVRGGMERGKHKVGITEAGATDDARLLDSGPECKSCLRASVGKDRDRGARHPQSAMVASRTTRPGLDEDIAGLAGRLGGQPIINASEADRMAARERGGGLRIL
jgi:hypothetical protein